MLTPQLEPIAGVHHITGIASGPQRNLTFYTTALGLRLVKKTVNFDDPGTYHFYFGDAAGAPGTILTFFPWSDARPGAQGAGQVTAVGFAVPPGSLGYWAERLAQYGASPGAPLTRFDQEVLPARDPDGLPLELVAEEGAAPLPAWKGGPVPAAYAIRGFAAPTLMVSEGSPTLDLLTRVFGFQPRQEGPHRVRLAAAGESAFAPGRVVDVEARPDLARGRMGAGVIHHIAFRVPDGETQLRWRDRLIELGFQVTPVMDRQYFTSIYFREPAGILFELATDPPGFALDEPVQALGSALKLPPWLEPRRETIERILPPVTLDAV